MDRINELIKNASSVAVIGHVRPDGDCVGSCLALQQVEVIFTPTLKKCQAPAAFACTAKTFQTVCQFLISRDHFG